MRAGDWLRDCVSRRSPRSQTRDLGHPWFIAESEDHAVTILAPGFVDAAGVVFYNYAVAMLALIEEQLLQCAGVKNVVADHTVAETLVDDAIRWAELAGVAIVAAGLNIVSHQGDAAGSIEKYLRGIKAPKVDHLAAALEKIPGDGELRARRVVSAQGEGA